MRSGLRFQHVNWPLGEFSPLGRFSTRSLRRYPIRFLRYWFARRLLENLHAKLGRPISVLEVGVGQGQMLAFMGGPHIGGDRYARPDWIGRWDGVDVNVDQSTRDRYSYSELMEADVETPFVLDEQGYDAVLLLHVLEHLFDPESALRHIGKALRPGGLLIGGSPTMPAWLASMHEPFLRWKFRKVLDDVHVHRHLSVITPSRVARFAEQNEFETELLAGTFLCRWSGVSLEDTEWWARANLLWGAMFPSLVARSISRCAGPARRCLTLPVRLRSPVRSRVPCQRRHADDFIRLGAGGLQDLRPPGRYSLTPISDANRSGSSRNVFDAPS